MANFSELAGRGVLARLARRAGEIAPFSHILANIGSVAVLGVAGLSLNFLIGRFYGLEGLGVFSQALALYLIAGQVVAGGFAFSALYSFSTEGTTGARVRLAAMLLPVGACAVLIVLLAFASAGLVAQLLDSPALGAALPAIGVGAALFGINKVIGAALNGLGHMKAFAVLQAARLPFMLAVAAGLIALSYGVEAIGAVFAVAEAGLLALSALLFLRFTPGERFDVGEIGPALRQESRRGWQGWLIGLLADVNTKVDVLVLSLFASDRTVGIYALGALFAEGLGLAVAAVQNVINPRLASIIARRAGDELSALAAEIGRLLRPLLMLGAAVGLAFVAGIAPVLLAVEDATQSSIVFAILAGGIVIASPALAMNQSLNQAGSPIGQTQFYAVVALLNLALALLLIPRFGIYGAAGSAAVALLAQWLVLAALLRKTTGLQLPKWA